MRKTTKSTQSFTQQQIQTHTLGHTHNHMPMATNTENSNKTLDAVFDRTCGLVAWGMANGIQKSTRSVCESKPHLHKDKEWPGEVVCEDGHHY